MLGKRERPFVDAGVFPIRIIAWSNADILQTQTLIEGMRARIRRADLKGHFLCAQISRIKGNVRQKFLRNTLTPISRIGRHLQQLHLAVVYPATGITHQLRFADVHHALTRIGNLKRRPPRTVGAGQFIENLGIVPSIGAHNLRLHGSNRRHPCRLKRLIANHRSALHARLKVLRFNGVGFGILLGKFDTLMLFGIRKARVHGKKRTRVAQCAIVRVERALRPSLLCRKEKADTRWIPFFFARNAAAFFAQVGVLLQRITHDTLIASASQPLGQSSRLHDGVGIQAFNTAIGNVITNRIDFFAHRIAQHHHQAANPIGPLLPRLSV